MDEIYREQIIEKIKGKGATNPCPRCNNSKFTVLGISYLQLIEKPGEIKLGGPNIPVVLVACENCGFVSEHALGAFGLLNIDLKDDS